MFHPERLKEWRKKRGLTQEELAMKLNTTKGTISNYENGHSTPPNESLVSLADVLNVTTDYLLGRTKNPNQILSQEARDIIDNLELTDEEIRNKFPFEIDGRTVTDEEYKWFIASIRSKRSLDKS